MYDRDGKNASSTKCTRKNRNEPKKVHMHVEYFESNGPVVT